MRARPPPPAYAILRAPALAQCAKRAFASSPSSDSRADLMPPKTFFLSRLTSRLYAVGASIQTIRCYCMMMVNFKMVRLRTVRHSGHPYRSYRLARLKARSGEQRPSSALPFFVDVSGVARVRGI